MNRVIIYLRIFPFSYLNNIVGHNSGLCNPHIQEHKKWDEVTQTLEQYSQNWMIYTLSVKFPKVEYQEQEERYEEDDYQKRVCCTGRQVDSKREEEG